MNESATVIPQRSWIVQLVRVMLLAVGLGAIATGIAFIVDPDTAFGFGIFIAVAGAFIAFAAWALGRSAVIFDGSDLVVRNGLTNRSTTVADLENVHGVSRVAPTMVGSWAIHVWQPEDAVAAPGRYVPGVMVSSTTLDPAWRERVEQTVGPLRHVVVPFGPFFSAADQKQIRDEFDRRGVTSVDPDHPFPMIRMASVADA